MHNFMAQGLLNGKVGFSPHVISKSWVLQNGHFRQLLRDQSCDSLGASQREPIFEGRNKPQFRPAETVSSFSSR
jgi:hypothetical protein